MEEIIEHLENLIDDLERDGLMTREETLNSLKEIKEKAEDINLSLDY